MRKSFPICLTFCLASSLRKLCSITTMSPMGSSTFFAFFFFGTVNSKVTDSISTSIDKLRQQFRYHASLMLFDLGTKLAQSAYARHRPLSGLSATTWRPPSAVVPRSFSVRVRKTNLRENSESPEGRRAESKGTNGESGKERYSGPERAPNRTTRKYSRNRMQTRSLASVPSARGRARIARCITKPTGREYKIIRKREPIHTRVPENRTVDYT